MSHQTQPAATSQCDTWHREGSETFQSIAVGPVTVSGGFLVAALMTHKSGEYPAAMDTTTPQSESWIGLSETGAPDLNPANPVGTSDLAPVHLVGTVPLGFFNPVVDGAVLMLRRRLG